MKRRILLIIIVFTGMLSFANAQNVTLGDAKTFAKNFLITSFETLNKRTLNENIFSEEFSIIDGLDTLYYIFNIKNNEGFIILSADKRAHPVIGYSNEGSYSIINQPPAFIEWMNYRKEELKSIRINKEPYNNEINLEWNKLTNSNKSYKSLSQGPLLTTKWDQGCYYNDMCPADTAGKCGHTYTGCCATSMAQILKYWNYPIHGNDTLSYIDPNYGLLSVNFYTTTYNWSNMNDSLSSANNDVATLIYHCGVSLHTTYGVTGSSGGPSVNSLVNYFNYSPSVIYLYKCYYSDSDWQMLLRNEIDSLRPVWYMGCNSNNCHLFVCDGYQNNSYFHFNWGWSGFDDGYYYLSNLNPDFNGTFTISQEALIRIQPKTSLGIDNYNFPISNINYYPNPTKDNLTIETNSNREQRLEILNLIGQTVYTSNINNKATIKTSAFLKGVYILKLSSNKESVVKKFVKE